MYGMTDEGRAELMGERITIKKIAELAGVSTSAVSFVLNDKKGVSDATRERVLKVIRDTNYIPDVNSRRLACNRSFNILVAVENETSPLSNYFYSSVLNYIVEYGTARGYNVVLVMIAEPFGGSRLESTLLQHNADGIVFLHDISEPLQRAVEEVGVPFVVLDSQKSEPPYPCVRGDYVRASYVSTRHLIDSGHKKIGFIGSRHIGDFCTATYEGYRRAMIESGLPMAADWVCTDARDERSAQTCMQKLLDAADVPTAVFCAGDLFAVAAMNYLQNNGYVLPRDFSFSSIDDISLARHHYPALTTVRIDDETMARQAVEILDGLINDRDVETDVVVHSDDLIVRGSVRRID